MKKKTEDNELDPKWLLFKAGIGKEGKPLFKNIPDLADALACTGHFASFSSIKGYLYQVFSSRQKSIFRPPSANLLVAITAVAEARMSSPPQYSFGEQLRSAFEEYSKKHVDVSAFEFKRACNESLHQILITSFVPMFSFEYSQIKVKVGDRYTRLGAFDDVVKHNYYAFFVNNMLKDLGFKLYDYDEEIKITTTKKQYEICFPSLITAKLFWSKLIEFHRKDLNSIPNFLEAIDAHLKVKAISGKACSVPIALFDISIEGNAKGFIVYNYLDYDRVSVSAVNQHLLKIPMGLLEPNLSSLKRELYDREIKDADVVSYKAVL